MALTFPQWRAHIDQVVADEGQWIGVLDQHGEPLFELGGVVSHSFPETRLAADDVEVTLSVAANPRVMRDLVGDDFTALDGEGHLVPTGGVARCVCIVRPGGRQVAQVAYATLSGAGAPSTLTLHATGLLGMLDQWPCPSAPGLWSAARFTSWSTDASGVDYARARDLAQIKMATVADGYTLKGKALTVVRNLIQDSLDVVDTLHGWVGDRTAVVEVPAVADASREVLIRPTDDSVLATISDTCRTAGVDLDVRLWWPGDPDVRYRRRRDPYTITIGSWGSPMLIITATQIGETP